MFFFKMVLWCTRSSLQKGFAKKIMLCAWIIESCTMVQPDWRIIGQEETKTPCQTQQNKRTETSLIVTKIKVREVQTSIKSDKLEVRRQIQFFIYAKGLHCRSVTPIHLSAEQRLDDVTTSVVFLLFFLPVCRCVKYSVSNQLEHCVQRPQW